MCRFPLKPLFLAILALSFSINSSIAKNGTDSDQFVATLPESIVYGKKDIMQSNTSADDVYDKNESSAYKDKKQLERYMGESPSDIFKGMSGVQSGDARNSGAIDPNVRGIQGQGRVPVTIDGTEQAITVYRGYAGANNRNYIDPLLISGVKVNKGASFERGVRSSVGGAVTINTLNVNDVINPDDNFGFNIKGTIANNTTAANAIDYASGNNLYAGDYGFDAYPEQDLYNPDKQTSDTAKAQAQTRRGQFLSLSGDLPRRTFDAASSKKPKDSKRLVTSDDKAIRFAVAGRAKLTDSAKFDGVAAYTYRHRGNYFSGKHGSSNYRTDTPLDERSTGDFAAYMADVYQPSAEVPNTSNKTESYLAKLTLRPNDDQAIQFGVRHSDTTYGDIMPSRVVGDNVKNGLYDVTRRLPQWPLSNAKLDSRYVQYRYDPANNPWLDFHSNLWQTKSTLHTNNSGGYPFLPLGIIGRTARTSFENYQRGMIDQFSSKFPEVKNCTEEGIRSLDASTLCGQLATLYGSNTQIKGDAFMTTYNNRTGFSLSNTASVTEKLDITLVGNWQKQKLWSDAIQNKLGLGFVALPRKGRREAWDASVSFDYRPTSKWQIQAGATYNNYWAFDDLVNERRKQGLSPNKSTRITGYNLLHYQKANQKVQDMLAAYNKGDVSGSNYETFFKAQYPNATISIPQIYGRDVNAIAGGQDGTAYVQQQYIWKADDQGNFSRDNNPFFNGNAQKNGWLRPAKIREITKGNFKGSGQAVPITADVTVGDRYKSAKKHKAWALTPSIAVAYRFSDQQRIYARYAQSTRMPSLYESTLGFSLQSIDNENQIKPEKGSNLEVGYVLDMSSWFNRANHADVKLAAYHNRINDIIDRTDDLTLKNFDHQSIQGIELQSRYDDDDWFGNLNLSHTLKHEVCDAKYAITQDPYYGQVPDCVKYGFGFGYLQNMGQPDWQANLTLGKYLYNKKLTLGSRLHYHSDADKGANAHNYGYSNEGTVIFNTPINWSAALTLDGFASYTATDWLTLEISGTNLTNRYYIDPLSRTLMPAPGRALTAKAEVKF